MRVNVTVVIIPPISCSEHSRITTEALVKVVWDSNHSNATGSSLAQDAHSSTLITQDLQCRYIFKKIGYCVYYGVSLKMGKKNERVYCKMNG